MQQNLAFFRTLPVGRLHSTSGKSCPNRSKSKSGPIYTGRDVTCKRKLNLLLRMRVFTLDATQLKGIARSAVWIEPEGKALESDLKSLFFLRKPQQHSACGFLPRDRERQELFWNLNLSCVFSITKGLLFCLLLVHTGFPWGAGTL